MPYTLPNLPYPTNALEPHIDAKTMEIHHDKHHAAYVNNVNTAMQGAGVPDQSIEDLCRNIESVPANIRPAVRNNGGGHANHSLFWTIMSASGGGKPSGELASAIDLYKLSHHRRFITFEELYDVMVSLGYHK